MVNLEPKRTVKYNLLLLATTLLTFSAVACDTPQQVVSANESVVQTTAVSLTNTPNVAATATELAFRYRVLGEPPSVIINNERNPTVQASDDATTKNYADMLTQSALTPLPTIDTNPLPTDTPMPTPTAGAGLYQCSSLANMQHNVPVSCGYWVVNGQLVGAKAGRRGRSGDVRQGYIEVACIGHDTADYDTPFKVGAVRVNDVQGTRFILGAVDANASPNTFAFDIATCQWVSP